MSESNNQSFISEARREQIIQASIQTLDEIGFVKTSLARIASKAHISTALISYHFSDKIDLMNHVLTKLVETSAAYISARVDSQKNATEKLIAFVEAGLAYQGTHHMNNSALLEIIFNARTPDNFPYYKLTGDEEDGDATYALLCDILRSGQESKEFTKFHIQSVATFIQGAIGESMFVNADRFDLETYSQELVRSVLKLVK